MSPKSDDRSRWPRWIYDEGDEPDYRWSLANERTYLAWIRTALALVAAGVVLNAVDLEIPDVVHLIAGAALLIAGIVCAVLAWLRWAFAERAMRRREPFAGSAALVAVTAIVVIAGVVLLWALV